MLRIAVVSALVCALMTACGRSGSKAAPFATPRAPSTAPTTFTRPVSSSTPTTTPRSDCIHRPIAHQAGDLSTTLRLPPLEGVSFDYPGFHAALPVDDPYGDTISEANRSVYKYAEDGIVSLTLGDGNVEFLGFGDFDGDRRGDLLVLSGAAGVYTTYLVPGTVAPGTYDPAEVGVPLWKPNGGLRDVSAAVVGDQDGDRADDVTFGTELYSGRALAALPDGVQLPAPLRTLPSDVLGLLEVDARDAPAFVLADRATPSLRVLDARSDRLLPDPADATSMVNSIGSSAQGGVSGHVIDGEHIVAYEVSDRGGHNEQWRWNLDAPCET